MSGRTQSTPGAVIVVEAPAAIAAATTVTLGAGWMVLGPALVPDFAALPVRIAAPADAA